MLVQSFLVQGAAASAAAMASKLGSLNPSSLEGLVLMSLGMEHDTIVQAVQNQKDISCPVFVTETYGIIGFDEESGKNIELMEKGRGTEYGFRGGSGGQGCLAIGYSDGAILGSNNQFPPNASSLMVIADQSGSWKNDQSNAPLHYGGITKKAWRLDEKDGLVQVPYFWVADTSGRSTGVSTFTGDAGEATKELLSKLPSGCRTAGSIGLFPCFSRGVNQYDAEHVEPTAIGEAIQAAGSGMPQIYGMFAHGELGPTSFSDFTNQASNTIPCTQHSMASILSMHTTTS